MNSEVHRKPVEGGQDRRNVLPLTSPVKLRPDLT